MRIRAMVVLVVMLFITACANTGTSPSASQPASQAPSGSASADPSGSAPASSEPLPSSGGEFTEDIVVGVVTDIGQLEDKSFNEYSWRGAVAGAEAVGAEEPDVIVTDDVADYNQNIQQLIDDGANVIVTIGFLITDETRAFALTNPEIQFIGVDQFVPDPLLPNLQGILFAEAQPGYLAGIVAATVSESGVIGAVGGVSSVPPVYAYINGYRNGAASVNPDIEVLINYTEDFNDPAKGETAANAMIGADADVIFQVAGLTGAGALRAACEADIWGIGVDVDQHGSLPDAAECIITSAEKKLETAVKQAIERVANEGYQTGNFLNNAENDGIGLSPFTNFEATADLQAAVDEALAGFEDGSLDPCAPIDCTGTNLEP
jgi:basic membrane protein A and related proteins